MPTPTYDLIASSVLGTATATVTFSSIPATYRDLVGVFTGTATGTATLRMQFNGDTGLSYVGVYMAGDGTNATSAINNAQNEIRVSNLATMNSQSVIITQIMDYSATDKHTTVLSRGNTAGVAVDATASRWTNSSAVNSVTFLPSASQSFSSAATFYLYGIAS